MKKIFINIRFSFPVQLLLLHLKKHHLLLIFWFLLFGVVTNSIGNLFGLPYLFLDPEYLGSVSKFSYFILGFALGAFIMIFQVTSYMLNSFRFPFLATLKHPFWAYFLNNGIIPLIFLIIYVHNIVKFQSQTELEIGYRPWLFALSMLAGMFTLFLGATLYFSLTNKNIFSFATHPAEEKPKEKLKGAKAKQRKALDWETVQLGARGWPVKSIISRRFRFRAVRGVEHYEVEQLNKVFRQHHLNAFFVQVFSLSILIALGLLMDNKYFVIPAGASIFLIFSTLMMLSGAFSYWTRGWRTTAFIIAMIIMSVLVQKELFYYQNKVPGLSYSLEKPEYTHKALASIFTPEVIQEDKKRTLEILENWKEKNAKINPSVKPKMVFVNASGGGVRASLWAMKVMMDASDSLRQELFDNTIFMTGASGGLIGLAYYRELMYRMKLGLIENPFEKRYLNDISRDLLNPIASAIVVNDLFYPWQKFERDGEIYRKDRGYIFDKYLNLNTRNFMDKPLSAYQQPEYQAEIPMMIVAPTIINDERKLLISPQPVAYLTQPANYIHDPGQGNIDGVDYGRFFIHDSPLKINFATVLRMNATYPYVLPTVSLPTVPEIECMDAGIRDNYGIENTIKFISHFKDWISKNTSGVIVININSVNTDLLLPKKASKNLFSKLFKPIGNLYSNWTDIQAYNQRYLLGYAKDMLGGKLDLVEFNYVPGEKVKASSMSFHLTASEKREIIKAIKQPINIAEMERLIRLVKE